MVMLMAIGETWWFTPLPTTISFAPFFDLLSHPLTSTGIKNSVGLSIAATALNLGIGFMAASVLALQRNTVTHRVFAALIVSPLAVPGLIFALGSLALFSSTILDPRINPLPLLAIGYAIKRLPFSSQTLEAGLLGIDRSGIEAAMLCGASRYTVLRRIVFPQLRPFIVTCAALCFASSMLEVGESFILALKEPFYPITKAMYALLARPDGERMASALGIVSMVVILSCLVVAHLSSRRGGITVRHE
jgi:iron(III) transport system permease protein